jgi:RimJ/RimL family protein N-acetyltransferase
MGQARLQDLCEVRPFGGRPEYERMVDYFLDADDKFLQGMGVARANLPSREDWISAALSDHERPNHEKDRAYLAWIYDGTAIGHSSINKIRIGDEAFIHLHIWVRTQRQRGLGTRFFQLSVARFVEDFSLKRLYCEPHAENPGPNRILQNSGFQLVKRYRTVPGAICFEQDVNLYVREFS